MSPSNRPKCSPRRFRQLSLESLEPRVLLSGAPFFVATAWPSETIGEYTTSGATINASLTSTLGPSYMAISGSDLFTSSDATSPIGEYTLSGATVSSSLVSGLAGVSVFGIAASGSDLFVAANDGSVEEYSTSGAPLNVPLISGATTNPRGLAVAASDLFLVDGVNNSIGEYTTAGATINASLITGLSRPTDIAVSGSDLFVTNTGTGTVGEYTTSGATINASLISGLSSPEGIAVYGSDLLIANTGNGTIGEYTTTGAPVNTALITGLVNPTAVVVPTTVTGEVFNDSNGNHRLDRGETGMARVTVTLQQKGARPFLAGPTYTTTSAHNGTYSFSGVAAGTYTLSETVPHGYKETDPRSGSYTVTITDGSDGQIVSGENFGNRKKKKSSAAAATVKMIIEKHADGYVAYPVGISGVTVGQGDTYEQALADVQSAIRFHLDIFGPDSLTVDEPV